MNVSFVASLYRETILQSSARDVNVWGATFAWTVPKVEDSVICNMCFSRLWTYPDSEIVDVASEQDELWLEEDED